MREWGIFEPRYLATKLIHQPDKLAGVSIADSAIGRPATCKSRIPKNARDLRFLLLARANRRQVPGTCQRQAPVSAALLAKIASN